MNNFVKPNQTRKLTIHGQSERALRSSTYGKANHPREAPRNSPGFLGVTSVKGKEKGMF